MTAFQPLPLYSIPRLLLLLLLLQGLLPNMLKLAPAAGISWAVFEEMKAFLVVDPPR